jgi:SAM-dependent methyltransferase
MRLNAKEGYPSIKWMEGTAEKTGLPSSSIDWVTMASSFHWADFDTATKEFWRVLKPGGWFTALWNPRLIEANPLLVEIEDYIKFQIPKLERVSSGRSGITNTLNERLESSPFFENVIYIEGHHKINMSPERYIGAWRSVNDLQVKLGPKRFEDFITYLWEKVGSLPAIETTYLTRAWSARKIGS